MLAGASSSVSGTVYEREGDRVAPLAGTFVTLRTFSGRPLATVRSGRRGRYQFAGLPRERLTLTAERSGYYTERTAGSAGLRLVIDCTEGCGIEAADFELARGGVISGSVVDRLGEPVQGVKVSVASGRAAAAGPDSRERNLSGATDDRGQFRIAGLRPGSYTVSFQGRLPGSGRQITRRTILLAAGEQTGGIRITLGGDQEFQVRGRISGVPYGQGYRTWLNLQSLDGSGRRVRTNVSAEGTFEMESLTGGRYLAGAVAVERKHLTREEFLLGVVEIRGDTAGLSLQPIETASLEGEMEIFAGRPPASGAVQLASNDGHGSRWIQFRGASKDFQLSDIVPGSYRLQSSGGRFYVKGVRHGDRIDPADQVTLTPGVNRLRIVIAADHGRVFGTVRDHDSRAPLSNARVVLDGERGKLQAQSDQAGHFLFGEVIPGEYRICAWADISPEALDDEAVWEQSGCASRYIPIDPESEIEIDLRATP